MGNLMDNDANDVLDSLFGNGTGAPTHAPSTYYLALSTSFPYDDGSNITEPTDTAYHRVAMANDATVFLSAAARQKTTAIDFVFAAPTADWGLCRYFVLFDAVSGGTARAWGEITPSQDIAVGVVPRFLAGSLVISVSPS